VAALKAVFLPEAFLQRMEAAVGCEPLDRRDRRADGLDGEDRAGLRAPAVDENRARSALTRIAPDVRACEAQLLAKEVDEEHARVDVALAKLAVDGHRQWRHGCICLPESAIAYSKTSWDDTVSTGPR